MEESDPDNALSSGQDLALILYLILEAFDRNGQKWMKTFTSVAKVLKNELKGLKWTYLTKFLVRREKQREPCGDNEGQAGYYMDQTEKRGL